MSGRLRTSPLVDKPRYGHRRWWDVSVVRGTSEDLREGIEVSLQGGGESKLHIQQVLLALNLGLLPLGETLLPVFKRSNYLNRSKDLVSIDHLRLLIGQRQ
jgi:hypothetical protein